MNSPLVRSARQRQIGQTLETANAVESNADEAAGGWPLPDLVSALNADLARVRGLTKAEAEVLARGIAERRARILALLRRHPRLVAATLRDAGRGVVPPEADFREREAVMVLRDARRRLDSRRGPARGERILRRFVQRLEAELAGYRVLRDRMMTANVRLVMSVARRYHHPTLSFLDLVQEGILGLLRAVEKYEPARQIKFSTYAVWWIWQQIARAADCQGALVRTPVHWNQLRRRLGRQGREPGVAEVAPPEHLTPERMTEMTQALQYISLAAPFGHEDQRTLSDILAARADDEPERSVADANLSERLATAVRELPEREAQIVRLRFGLSGRAWTLEEVGDRFGVSRERIRQLEARALKRMRVICAAQRLGDHLT